MFLSASPAGALESRHFSVLAAPDAIALIELLYLPIILTTHTTLFLRESLAFSIASGECWHADVTNIVPQVSQDYHAATWPVKGTLPELNRGQNRPLSR